jgi:lipoic acid synthetase
MDGSLDKLPLSRAERHPEKAHRPDNPMRRKPEWIRVRAPNSPEYAETKRLMRQYGLATVCEEAACPNIGECWKYTRPVIMGEVCTRACAFCTSPPAAGALTARTGQHCRGGRQAGSWPWSSPVDRDDPDGGASHFAEVISALQSAPSTTVEILTPDFPQGRRRRDRGGRTTRHLQPQSRDVLRLYPTIRPCAPFLLRPFAESEIDARCSDPA